MLKKIAWVVLAAVSAFLPAHVLAQPVGLSEIRGGLYAHSVDEPGALFGVFNVERVEDINAELLFDVPSLNQWLAWGTLRPHLGATLNLAGRESMIYGGISWTLPLAETPFFLEASFGGAVHNGNTTGGALYPERGLGCPVMFREALSLGMAISDRASIMATAEHSSNANLCHQNRGLTNLGVRFGYRF